MLAKFKTLILIALVLVGSLTISIPSAQAQTSHSSNIRLNKISHLKAQITRMDKADDRLMQLTQRLETRINMLASQGKDVGNLQNLLADTRVKLNDASLQYQNGQNLLANIQPTDTNLKAELSQVRADIKAGALDLKAARTDLKQIRAGLKALK